MVAVTSRIGIVSVVFCLILLAPSPTLAVAVKSNSTAMLKQASQQILKAASPWPLPGIFAETWHPAPPSDVDWDWIATSLSFLPPPSGPGWGLWVAYQLRISKQQRQQFPQWIFCFALRLHCFMALWCSVAPPLVLAVREFPGVKEHFLLHDFLLLSGYKPPSWNTLSQFMPLSLVLPHSEDIGLSFCRFETFFYHV